MLDRRVSILRQSSNIDDGYTVTPGELGVLINRPAAKVGGSFWLRSDSQTRQVVETDKLVYAGRVYEIFGIREIGRREGLEIIVEGGDDGYNIDLSGLSPIPIASDIEVRVEAIEALIENTDLEQGDGIDIVGNDIRLDIENLPLAPGN
jgi:hypothetical protein